MMTAGGMQHVASNQAGMNGGSQSVEALSRLASIKNGMAGKQQICDLKSAKYPSRLLSPLFFINTKKQFDSLRNAIDDLLNELGTATSMLKSDPFAVLSLLGVPDGIMPTSTRGQLGQKLAIAATSVGKTAMKMFGMTEEEFSAAMPELGMYCKSHLCASLLLICTVDEAASRLSREIASMLETAILHASVDDKAADGTLATAKTLVEGARLFITDVMKLKESPSDTTAKDALLVCPLKTIPASTSC